MTLVVKRCLVVALLVTMAGCSLVGRGNQISDQNEAPKATNADQLSSGAGLKVAIEEVEYFEGVKGYYARPMEGGEYPGVVMIHEWWGLNDQIKEMAKELAGEGYQVLAVDLFSSVAADADKARAQVAGLDQETALENMKAAVEYLREKGATRVGSLGWCFGGGQSMQLAVSGEELEATVIYYGNLVTDKDQLQAIGWPVLGVFGDEDQSIPVQTVREFEAALEDLGIAKSVNVYEGVGHAFANPTGQSYAREETKDAWQKTLEFLESNLKAG